VSGAIRDDCPQCPSHALRLSVGLWGCDGVGVGALKSAWAAPSLAGRDCGGVGKGNPHVAPVPQSLDFPGTMGHMDEDRKQC
jgi:hypothetical protein